MWEAQYFPHTKRRSLLTSGGLGTMGYALPAAIGAQVGNPDEEMWVVAGDGGFQMTMPELSTVVARKIADQNRIHQQWLPGHGPPMAGHFLQQTVFRNPAI